MPDIIREIKGRPGFTLKVALPGGKEALLRRVHVDRKDAALLARWRTDHCDQFFTRIRPEAEEVLDWLNRYQSDDTELMFLLEYPPGRPVGQMALSNIDLQGRSAEFGRIIRGAEGAPRDSMYHAAQTLIAWALRSLHLRQIDLQVFADNHRAVRMYGALGFHVAEIQHYQRSITAKGVEQYRAIEQQRTGDDAPSVCVVYRMILNRGREHDM